MDKEVALAVFLAARSRQSPLPPQQEEDCLVALVEGLVVKHRQLLVDFLVLQQRPLVLRVNRHQPVDYLARNQLVVLIYLRKVRSLVHRSHSRTHFWQELLQNLLQLKVVVA